MVAGIVLMVIFALTFIGALTYLIIRNRKLATAVTLEIFNLKKEFSFAGFLILATSLSFMLFFVGVILYNNDTWNMNALDWLATIFGSFFTCLTIVLLFTIFRIHYWQKLIDKKIDKIMYSIMIACFPLSILFIWLFTNGLAPYLTYPLPNGISFSPFGLVSISTGSANIAFYALCILAGAILVYFICDHFMYQRYGKHGIVESTFLVAFPSGIIGARIAYVIGEWETFANREWWSIFAIWEGGLTILGGAIVGIVVGCIWLKWRHKEVSLGEAVNIIVPTILIAQAIGRFGNFFNCEVHGYEVSEEYFRWLPKIIFEQSKYSSTHAGGAAEGMIYIPLFFIEAIINIIGYYVLAFVIGRGLKKYVKNFDLAFGYIIWYGLTRVFMEPLRDSSFNMGSDGGWSWYWSIVFVAVGLLAVIINHIVWHFIDENKQRNIVITNDNQKTYLRNSYIGLGVCLVVALAFFITGLCLFINFEAPTTSVIALVPHNIGLIFLIIGSVLITSISIPIIHLIKGYTSLKKVNS